LYHQNIQGLKCKAVKITNFLYPDFIHVLCFTEHHLNQHEINLINTVHFSVGAQYCRHFLTKRGIRSFVHNNLNFINIDLDKFSNDQDIEACAVKLSYFPYNFCILSPHWKLYFINELEAIINSLHNTNTQFFNCSDLNIHFLVENNNNKKKLLDSLLSSYNF